MKLIELEQRIKDLGYWAMYRPSIKVLFCTIVTPHDFEATEKMMQIEMEGDKYRCTYSIKQLPITNMFDSAEAVVSFVHQHYQALADKESGQSL